MTARPPSPTRAGRGRARAPRWPAFAVSAAALTLPDLAAELAAAAPGADDLAFFEKRVRPVLAEHCYRCHSAGAEKIKGGLLLDTREGWMNGGNSGEVIVPGEPAESLLIAAVRRVDPDLKMPPKTALATAQVAALEEWVRRGAPDPRDGPASEVAPPAIDLESGRQFWAFQPPLKRDPPPVRDAAWPVDDLDHFVLAAREAAGLAPSEDAGRATLIRRASFDLTGLPPTPAEVAAFVADPSPDREAFARVVDRLLASGRFGERWGRHWLDVVRYAESMGRTRNYPFPYAWRYRDYVIDAFNKDKPFDRFLTEQLAGDLLPAADDAQANEQLIATGFLALGSQDLNERNAVQFKMDVVDEQIDVTGRAFLALTTGCARCHDHKFDPIPTTDYYALAGIFKSTDTLPGLRHRGGGGNKNYADSQFFVALRDTGGGDAAAGEEATRERQRQRVAAVEEEIAATKKKIAYYNQRTKAPRGKRKGKGKNQPVAAAAAAGSDAPEQRLDPAEARKRSGALRRKLKQLNKQLAEARKGGPPRGDLAMGVQDAVEPADARVFIRGDITKPGPAVKRGFLQVCFPGEPPAVDLSGSGRLELASWMTSPDHPLTARVFANRVWHHLTGRGIVRTVDNFGQSGERPTHPELLDHLALRLVAGGWSVKRLVRDIMLSRTYRMGSAFHPANYAADPDNRLLWRANIRRLEAEAIRDAVLAVSGQLDLDRPQASPVMRMKGGEVGRNTAAPSAAKDLSRSVYLPVLRGYVPPSLEVFDFAEPSQVTGRRDVTTVPTQALFLMNNPFVLSRARDAADALLGDREADDGAGPVAAAYEWSLGRAPSAGEAARANAFIADFRAGGRSQPEAYAALFQSLFASAEFRYLK